MSFRALLSLGHTSLHEGEGMSSVWMARPLVRHFRGRAKAQVCEDEEAVGRGEVQVPSVCVVGGEVWAKESTKSAFKSKTVNESEIVAARGGSRERGSPGSQAER